MWAKIDDELFINPKWLKCRTHGRALWTSALSFVAKMDTGGFFPDYALKIVGGTKNAAQHLVDVGLWEATDGGWDFHDWSEYQLTEEGAAARMEARKSAKSERQAKYRARQKAEADTRAAKEAEAQKATLVDAHVDAVVDAQSVYNDALPHAGACSEPVPVPDTRIGDTLRVPPPPPTPATQNQVEGLVGGGGKPKDSDLKQGQKSAENGPGEIQPLALCCETLPPAVLLARFKAEYPQAEQRAGQVLAAASTPVSIPNQAAYLKPWICRVVKGLEPDPIPPAADIVFASPPRKNGRESVDDIIARGVEQFTQFQATQGVTETRNGASTSVAFGGTP